METPLNASSTTAGALLSGGRFRVPEFQREYAWENEEVREFFDDLAGALHDETYFLGLVILTGPPPVRDVVDGQQRLLTLTLLASALCHQARAYERNALAERLQSTFLRFIDFDSDLQLPRLELSDPSDNQTLNDILDNPYSELWPQTNEDSVSALLLSAYKTLSELLAKDLQPDPFKRLGLWAEFLTSKLYMASFAHPSPASAYRVFEVINTRGKELTTADLLKSYVLSQTGTTEREQRYQQWQLIAKAFDNASTFVQFIRHAVTTQRGHVAPRDLYDVLAGRRGSKTQAMTPEAFMNLLEDALPLYLQVLDPTAAGPAKEEQLGIFSVLSRMNVVAVRPIILAIANTSNSTQGMLHLLRLVVKRIVVGNLGTGNVERRFGQAAQRITQDGTWQPALKALEDLNPEREVFEYQVHRRSLNSNVLAVLRQSVLQHSVTPDPEGFLYQISPRGASWTMGDEDRVAYWASTIGNSFLSTEPRRPMGSSSWDEFRQFLLPNGVENEWVDLIGGHEKWGIDEISEVGKLMASEATDVWYGNT